MRDRELQKDLSNVYLHCMAHRINRDKCGILHQNPTARSNSYWDLGSQDPPLFPGLTLKSTYTYLKFSKIVIFHQSLSKFLIYESCYEFQFPFSSWPAGLNTTLFYANLGLTILTSKFSLTIYSFPKKIQNTVAYFWFHHISASEHLILKNKITQISILWIYFE